MTRIAITGGTRGFGRALAEEFLDRGARVFITGRKAESLATALAELSRGREEGSVSGGAGDASDPSDIERLAGEALAALGGVDHWILNAGVSQASGMAYELPAAELERVVRTDFLGPLLGARAAWPSLLASGGFLWFVEGHGSDGRVIPGVSVYGAAKRGVAYLARALAREARGTGVRVGAISPGIMVTDFILEGREAMDEASRERSARIFDILGDRPGTVAAWIAPRLLAAGRNGSRLVWLHGAKILARFLLAPFRRRSLMPR